MDDINSTPIEFDDLMKVDMRVGTVISCEPNPKAKKPAYILTHRLRPTRPKDQFRPTYRQLHG